MEDSVYTSKSSAEFFKTLMDDYVESISSRYGISKGLAFSTWYFQVLIGYTKEIADIIITDGPGDNNIDAIEYDKKNKTVHFYQFKNPLLGKSIGLKDISGFIAGIEEIRRYMTSKEEPQRYFNQKLKKRLEEVKILAENNEIMQYSLKIILGTNAVISEEADGRLQTYVKSWRQAGANVKYEFEKLVDLRSKFERTIFGTPVDVITFKLLGVPRVVYESKSEPQIRILTGLVSGSEIAEKYLEHRELLLMKNIRVGLQNSEINEDIKKTCTTDDATHFLYYNNGITFVTDKFDASFGVLNLYNPQIVNGGQTIRILAKALNNDTLREEVLVQIRIIELDNLDLTSRISQKLNYQNPVHRTDIIVSSVNAILFKKTLEGRGIYLERKSGEFNQLSDEQKSRIAQSLNCTKEELENNRIDLIRGVLFWIACYDFKVLSKFHSYNLSSSRKKITPYIKQLTLKDMDNVITGMNPAEFAKLYNICQRIVNNIPSSANEVLKISGYENPKIMQLITTIFDPYFLTGLFIQVFSRISDIKVEMFHTQSIDVVLSFINDFIVLLYKYVIKDIQSGDMSFKFSINRKTGYSEFAEWAAKRITNYNERITK